MDLFDVGPGVALTALSISAAILTLALLYFIHSAPPSSITISSGPQGSVFHKNAEKYAAYLERNGVKAKILTSEGSLENLARIADPNAHVDVGIVQSGLQSPLNEKVVSLGSISYQPLLVFYRGKKPVDLLTELEGKKVAVGPIGSGTRNFALALLELNGIKEGGPTKLLDLDALDSAEELMKGTLDAAFVMSENASSEILKKLLHADGIHLMSFRQAVGYARKNEFLNVLELPQGVVDFGKDIPPHDVQLLGPTVELVASKRLHPALVDLIIEAATDVHSKPGVFQKRHEFPNPTEHAIHISEDASRYYQSGKGYLYQHFPFWLASMISRFLVTFVPVLLVLIPALKSVPAFFRWLFLMKIHRRYLELRALEQKCIDEPDPSKREQHRRELDRIEEAVNRMKVRGSHSDQFYGLRGHIDYVRAVVDRKQAARTS